MLSKCGKEHTFGNDSNESKLHQEMKKKYFRGLVRQRIIPTERPPLVGEDSANFSG
jgi:hypothetical protein